jgi:hypothetical protein
MATGERLNFTGEFLRAHAPSAVLQPWPNPYGNPAVFLAGVGARMTEVAGEVADGFFAHSFTTERYLREATLCSRDASSPATMGSGFRSEWFAANRHRHNGPRYQLPMQPDGPKSLSMDQPQRIVRSLSCTGGMRSVTSSTPCPKPTNGRT